MKFAWLRMETREKQSFYTKCNIQPWWNHQSSIIAKSRASRFWSPSNMLCGGRNYKFSYSTKPNCDGKMLEVTTTDVAKNTDLTKTIYVALTCRYAVTCVVCWHSGAELGWGVVFNCCVTVVVTDINISKGDCCLLPKQRGKGCWCVVVVVAGLRRSKVLEALAEELLW